MKGRFIFSLAIMINQVMGNIGYLIFFMEQLDQVIDASSREIPRYMLLLITMACLTPLTTFFESMRQISYLSLFALISIIGSLIYILGTDVYEIVNPS
jgi:amino acid permease